MIPRDHITEWRAWAPWVPDVQVEQDLVISRALTRLPQLDPGFQLISSDFDRRASCKGLV